MEAAKQLIAERFRSRVQHLAEFMKLQPKAYIGDSELCPLTHTFTPGIYTREIFIPAGTLVVGAIHKHEHPFFILKGDVTVITHEGTKRLQGPVYGTSPAGVQRVVFAHTDTLWVTVHATTETDLAKVEDQIIERRTLCHGQS